ncbi:hypothetical protein J3R82DRAFT_6640 [Butyriboletus roseoflavus]|nr:hypothetical protein J3R82DRAFT_6640 [Butyriboletus roseoflavus]
MPISGNAPVRKWFPREKKSHQSGVKAITVQQSYLNRAEQRIVLHNPSTVSRLLPPPVTTVHWSLDPQQHLRKAAATTSQASNQFTPKILVSTVPSAYDIEVESKVTSNASDTKGIPWLACRDTYGVMTTIAVSETGEGIHVRWYYPEDDCEVDEDEDADVEMTVDDERDVTPLAPAGPSSVGRRPFPQTPMVPHPYDAGSVIRTPVKKARPLQRSPLRIGDKGIRCLYEKGGVLRELHGGARIVLRHPVGSTANLSRDQVERLEEEEEEKIIRVQVEKLLAEKERVEEEEKDFSDSGYEDEMETDHPSSQHSFQREGTDDTILISDSELSDIVSSVSLEEVDNALGFFRGPNGELLDHHGRQMLGREGTILVDSTYASPRRLRRKEVSTEIVDHSTPDHCASEPEVLRTGFGPEGTELID